MGNYISLFEKTEQEQKIILSPTKSDFITGYADLTGLAVVEVQRYWARFKQLGSDRYCNIPKGILDRSELGQNPFTKNILANLPKEKDGSLSFMVFLKFMSWMESASTEAKLRVLHSFINNGNELNSDVLSKLLRRVYVNNTEREIKMTTDLLMSHLDLNNTGRITENQFVGAIRRKYSDKSLNDMLRFDLIPLEVLDEANMQPSLSGSMVNLNNDKQMNSNMEIELTDDMLDAVARKAVKKNWEKLALKLGFLDSDINSLKAKNKGNPFDTLFDILVQWRDQDPYLATKNRLRRYLEETNMLDAAQELA